MNEVTPGKSSSSRLMYLLCIGLGIGIGWFVAKAPEIIQGKPPEVLPVNDPVDSKSSLAQPISPF